jgi:hypothetical protein
MAEEEHRHAVLYGSRTERRSLTVKEIANRYELSSVSQPTLLYVVRSSCNSNVREKR